MSYQRFNNSRVASVTPSDTEYIPNPSQPKAAASATNAIIVVSGGKVASVTLASPGIGYTLLGTLAFAITGTPGSSATLSPRIGTSGSILIDVTNGGSSYTDGTYVSGSIYTLTLSGSGTISNNVVPAQPCELWVLPKTANDTICVVSPSGDEVIIPLPSTSWLKIPFSVIQVKSTNTSPNMTALAVW